MRIGILTSVLTEGPSGVGWHIVRLLEHLAAIDRRNQYFLIERSLSGRGLPEDHPYRGYPPSAENFSRVQVRCPAWVFTHARLVYQTRILPRAIERLGLDVIHGAGQQIPARRQVPQILTVHDLATAEMTVGSMRERQDAKGLFQRYLGWSDQLVAVSKFARDDLIASFEVPRKKIRVIYEGGLTEFDEGVVDRHRSAATPRELQASQRNNPYVLYVGAIERRRNLGFLLRGFALFRERHGPGFNLVMAGRQNEAERQQLDVMCRELGIEDDVEFLGHVAADRVRALYEGASAFVMPSLHEGFGMVVLEAMAYGVPVIAARAGALPEVIGSAGLLVDLDDDVGLSERLHRVLTDGPTALALLRRGEQRFKQFSWRRMAEQTLALYEAVVTADRQAKALERGRGTPDGGSPGASRTAASVNGKIQTLRKLPPSSSPVSPPKSRGPLPGRSPRKPD